MFVIDIVHAIIIVQKKLKYICIIKIGVVIISKMQYFDTSVRQPIDATMTHLELFVDEYNKNIYDSIPISIKYLTFANYYNKPICISIPIFITHLTFGFRFNHSISEKMISSVTHLTFGQNFDKLFTIPESVTHLKFGNNFNQMITIPNSVVHLTFGSNFNMPINIPNSVKHLAFGNNFNWEVDVVNATHVTYGNKFRKQIINPSRSITHLTLSAGYKKYIPWTIKNITRIDTNKNKIIDSGQYEH